MIHLDLHMPDEIPEGLVLEARFGDEAHRVFLGTDRTERQTVFLFYCDLDIDLSGLSAWCHAHQEQLSALGDLLRHGFTSAVREKQHELDEAFVTAMVRGDFGFFPWT